MHSIRHVANDIARWADTVNTNTEAPEGGHKKWVKGQGGKTNQGPAANLSMMTHTVRKAASALCCEGVQGKIMIIVLIQHKQHNLHIQHILHDALIFEFVPQQE